MIVPAATPPQAVPARAAAERCLAGGALLAAGPRALLVGGPVRGGRAGVVACRRGKGIRVTVGSIYGEGDGTVGGARSSLLAAAVGGDIAAAAFEVAANGCVYVRGCADVPRQVVRIADTRARTLRRIPLHGTLSALRVSAAGATTFVVDEFACNSTYLTGAAPGGAVRLVRRVATGRTGGGGCGPP
jgi:hypothetical protein